MPKIPFHIISGFLGSGKTTFLKQIIQQYSEKKKLGIIQNEFAPANVDGAELKNTGKDFHLLEVNNGSVFCVCLLGNFAHSLEKFIDEFQPEILIIEASGLSDTTSISEVISAGSLNEKIYLASNWCIVDAPNFAKVGLMKQRVLQQLRMADIVLINKIDIDFSGLPQIEEEIKKINPFASIKKASFCAIDFELGTSAIHKFYYKNSPALPRPDIHSMVIKSSRQVSKEKLELFLNEWAPKAYRIKGFVKLKGNQTLAVQCTFSTVEMKAVEEKFYPTELIALSDKFTLREWNKAFKELSA